MRTVPVILNSELLDCLQIMLKHRHEAGVPSRNKFLFGIPSHDKKRLKHLRAYFLLRKFSDECGAKLPHTLRGTQLRKHIATCCITLNLSEDQVNDLANFMGHDKNIHKSHYRQPIPELEIIRITKLLEMAQGGTEEENEKDADDKGSDKSVESESEQEEVNISAENMPVETDVELNITPGSSHKLSYNTQSKNLPKSSRKWRGNMCKIISNDISSYKKKRRSSKLNILYNVKLHSNSI